MRSLVYLQVLRARKHLAASLERTRERLLAGVHPDVIDQLVLGLERPPVALASHPEARVLRALRSAHMLDGQMADDLAHRAEHLAAMLAHAADAHRAAQRMVVARDVLRIHPHADQLLFERGGCGGRGR